MKSPYDAWTTEAIRGYIVMMSDFLSGSMQEEPGRQAYVNRLGQARAALLEREKSDSGIKTSIAFPKETVGHTEEKS